MKCKNAGIGYYQPINSSATMDGFSTDAVHGGYRYPRRQHHSRHPTYDDSIIEGDYGDDVYYDDEYFD